ncbi:Ni/Fe hydrogenase subunit alpha [Aestuariibacter salexigens]|uniref:Ni/Fe hydrogenase subunit alpha n=1 Tax=Aestuariibacter salexigens TaxID=226010 RepID=UPI000419EF01|nr:nickel-dependent hydrogenase large subunit [Aestuariibacter salexigens]
MSREIKLNVPFITRVEGEGALQLSAKGDEIESLQLQIFEPPRLFERFLQGKPHTDVADLSARICGICPMAYQLTSILAMESLFEIELPDHIVDLRLLMNLGEWLQSHALHIHFLAMPDFYGYDSAVQMAAKHGDLLTRGMQIQEAGNTLMRLLGGRSVHPIGLQVGGFAALPDKGAWQHARQLVNDAIPAAIQLLQWTAELPIPDHSQDFTYVSLLGEDSYPINGGNIACSNGLTITAQQYPQHFKEHHVSHSTALYSLVDGQDYLVGPLARVNNNYRTIPEHIRHLAEQCGLEFPNMNMFTSIQARALECLWALFEAQQMLQYDVPKGQAHVPYKVREGECSFCTEAPRGLIFHHYELEQDGTVAKCTIIPPTSQNQARIEQDLKQSVKQYGLHHSDNELKLFCEQVIRNYDPCISCSTHFLDFTITRQ